MQPFAIVVLLTVFEAALAQQPSMTPAISDNGWNGDTNTNTSNQNRSWLAQNYRYLIIVILGIVAFSLLTWYIVRSIRGMRKRLARENEAQRQMMQRVGVVNTHMIPESVPIPMDYEKAAHHSSYPPHQHQQPIYTHRY